MRHMSPTDLVVRYLAERARPSSARAARGAARHRRLAGRAGDARWSTPRVPRGDGERVSLGARVPRVGRPRGSRARRARASDARDGGRSTHVALRVARTRAGCRGQRGGRMSTDDVGSRIAVLAAASGMLVVWYRLRGERATGVVGGHVVLIKYPAIALALAPVVARSARSHAWRAAAVLAAVYLGLCVYESFDDPELRASRAGARRRDHGARAPRAAHRWSVSPPSGWNTMTAIATPPSAQRPSDVGPDRRSVRDCRAAICADRAAASTSCSPRTISPASPGVSASSRARAAVCDIRIRGSPWRT